MELQKIKALIELASEARLSSFEFSEGGCTLRLERADDRAHSYAEPIPGDSRQSPDIGNRDVPSARANEVTAIREAELVSAPMLGMLYLAPKPEEPPFVALGDAVRKGQKLCLLEAMKVFHVVEARRDGVVSAILAKDGQEVEPGQPLFRIQ